MESSRLAHIRRLVQADLDALPNRPIPLNPEPLSDDDQGGGVALEASDLSPTAIDKQPVANEHTIPTLKLTDENPDRRFVLIEGAASSYSPSATMQVPVCPPTAAKKLPTTNLQRGDLASLYDHFTPLLAVAKYPYKFCNKQHSQDIASAFFDEGKFWLREWDLYYVWDVEPVGKPLILVHENQFQDFLKEINDHFKLNLRITDSQREEGLVSRFPDHPECRPRYLGRSESRQQYDDMASHTPSKNFRSAGEEACGAPENGTLEQFKQLMEELWDIQKAKNKAAKARKQQERLVKQKSMVAQFKRAQRHLGLRDSENTGPSGPAQPIDPSRPAPYDFTQSVVFVCIDVESFEKAHHMITEVGVATLDTRDLVDVAPGKDGEAWRDIIKVRHFRIQEHRHLVNSEFVSGNPDRFDYGDSTFVSLKEAPAHVAACFRPPFGVHASNTVEDEIHAKLSQMNIDGTRNIILLGHDTLGDVRYLQQLGYDPLKEENIIEIMDTATMYRVWRREQQPTNLGRILHSFDIAGWNLHNAGNDAMFTVQVMLAICVREATIRGSPELEAMRKEDQASKLALAQKDAIQRVKDNAEGWSDNEEDGDGGAPVLVG